MKKKIGIVTGGDSGEITISLKSAAIIQASIDKNKFDTYLICITQNKWIYSDNGTEQYVDKNDFSIMLNNKKITFDAVFIAIHGTPGEDGKLQGYFDLIGIPYTSCDLTTSAITFNKFYCNQLVKSLQICPVAKSIIIRHINELNENIISNTIGYPCFVKPNEGGSSLGVTMVKSSKELNKAVKLALSVDKSALIESYIKGREITCGVLQKEDVITALPITEIVSKNAFFDFEAKYNADKVEEITPAPISQDIWDACQNISKELYVFLNCKGVVRFDYILTESSDLYFLEVNTIPGMTKESIVPQQAQSMGMSTQELFTTLLLNTLKKK